MNINALLSRIRPQESQFAEGLKPSTMRLIGAMENRNLIPKDIDYEYSGEATGNPTTRTITLPRNVMSESSDDYFNARMGQSDPRSIIMHEASHVDQPRIWENVPDTEGEYSPLARAGRAELYQYSPAFASLRDDILKVSRPKNPIPSLLDGWDARMRQETADSFDETARHDMLTKEILADSNVRMKNAELEDERSGQLPIGDEAFRRSAAIAETSYNRPRALLEGTRDALARRVRRLSIKEPWLLEEVELPPVGEQGRLF